MATGEIDGGCGDAWAARRALCESDAAQLARIAAACRLNPAKLARRARDEGWRLPAVAERSREDRVRAIHDRLLTKMERADALSADDDVVFDKASLAEITAITRILEKIAAALNEPEKLKRDQMEQDDEIAGILERLDGRIVELASHLASELARKDLQRA